MSIAIITERNKRSFRRFLAIFCVWFCSSLSASHAETLEFYAHGSGLGPGGFLYFPHAFVLLRDEDGTSQATYGFTAISQSPGVLVRRSRGAVHPTEDSYIQKSQLFLTIALTPEQLQKIHDLADYWNSPEGSLYDLQNRNCVTFVAEIARAAGLVVPVSYDPLKPAVFMQLLAGLNARAGSGLQSRP